MTHGTLVTCYLQQSVLGPKRLRKTMAEICVEMAGTRRTRAEISENFLPVFCCFVLRARKTVRIHSDHLMHVFLQLKLVAPAKPSKTPFLALCVISPCCSPQHWKTKNTFIHSWWRFWPENYIFQLKISPCLKFRIVGFSRYVYYS